MNFIDQITTHIIRPTRQKYHINRLGPQQHLVSIPGHASFIVIRDDFITINKRGQKIVYSYYNNFATKYPDVCVVYLHANNGSRVQGLHYLQPLLKNKFNVCLLDFAGSGISEGDFITLGPNQTQDLTSVFQDMRYNKGINKLILWGRSMGACTALIYANKFPQNVVSMVLDSPFKDLRKLVKQIASQRTGLPKFFFDPLLTMVDTNLQKKIGHKFEEYKIKKYITQDEKMQKIKQQKKFQKVIPALFLASEMDRLVKCHHVQKLYDRYPGQPGVTKILHYITNQHHQNRDSDVVDLCINFITASLQNNNQFYNVSQTNYNSNTPQQLVLKNTNINLFDHINIVKENPKFSFKVQDIVRPESSIPSPKFKPYFCFGNKPTTDQQVIVEGSSKKNRKKEKINLSKNNERISALSQSFRSDLSNGLSLNIKHIDKQYFYPGSRLPKQFYYSKDSKSINEQLSRQQNMKSLRSTMNANTKQNMLKSLQAMRDEDSINNHYNYNRMKMKVNNQQNNEYTDLRGIQMVQKQKYNQQMMNLTSKNQKINLSSYTHNSSHNHINNTIHTNIHNNEQNQTQSNTNKKVQNNIANNYNNSNDSHNNIHNAFHLPNYTNRNKEYYHESTNNRQIPPIQIVSVSNLNALITNRPSGINLQQLPNNGYVQDQNRNQNIFNYNPMPAKTPAFTAQSPRHYLSKNRSNANIANNSHFIPNQNAHTKFQYGNHTGNKISLAKFGSAKEYHH